MISLVTQLAPWLQNTLKIKCPGWRGGDLEGAGGEQLQGPVRDRVWRQQPEEVWQTCPGLHQYTSQGPGAQRIDV